MSEKSRSNYAPSYSLTVEEFNEIFRKPDEKEFVPPLRKKKKRK